MSCKLADGILNALPLFEIDEVYSLCRNPVLKILSLPQTEEADEGVWAAALSCLLYLVCDRGRIQRRRLDGVDIRVTFQCGFDCVSSLLFSAWVEIQPYLRTLQLPKVTR